jgi:hypothetical protein
MKRDVIQHQFVESAPKVLEEGVLYVSTKYATALHNCCCGCGNEVVTPLSPTDWAMEFDGVSISLDPSVGNWSFPCQSHYWIRRNKVIWAPRWSRERIEAGRIRDRAHKDAYFSGDTSDGCSQTESTSDQQQGLLRTVLSWVGRLRRR